jgi:hypothetical protein
MYDRIAFMNEANYNLHGLAVDAWVQAIATLESKDPYKELCPCGCGKKWKYVLKELLQSYESSAHENTFIHNFMAQKEKHV